MNNPNQGEGNGRFSPSQWLAPHGPDSFGLPPPRIIERAAAMLSHGTPEPVVQAAFPVLVPMWHLVQNHAREVQMNSQALQGGQPIPFHQGYWEAPVMPGMAAPLPAQQPSQSIDQYGLPSATKGVGNWAPIHFKQYPLAPKPTPAPAVAPCGISSTSEAQGDGDGTGDQGDPQGDEADVDVDDWVTTPGQGAEDSAPVTAQGSDARFRELQDMPAVPRSEPVPMALSDVSTNPTTSVTTGDTAAPPPTATSTTQGTVAMPATADNTTTTTTTTTTSGTANGDTGGRAASKDRIGTIQGPPGAGTTSKLPFPSIKEIAASVAVPIPDRGKGQKLYRKKKRVNSMADTKTTLEEESQSASLVQQFHDGKYTLDTLSKVTGEDNMRVIPSFALDARKKLLPQCPRGRLHKWLLLEAAIVQFNELVESGTGAQEELDAGLKLIEKLTHDTQHEIQFRVINNTYRADLLAYKQLMLDTPLRRLPGVARVVPQPKPNPSKEDVPEEGVGEEKTNGKTDVTGSSKQAKPEPSPSKLVDPKSVKANDTGDRGDGEESPLKRRKYLPVNRDPRFMRYRQDGRMYLDRAAMKEALGIESKRVSRRLHDLESPIHHQRGHGPHYRSHQRRMNRASDGVSARTLDRHHLTDWNAYTTTQPEEIRELLGEITKPIPLVPTEKDVRQSEGLVVLVDPCG